jgi:hypothetical protein
LSLKEEGPYTHVTPAYVYVLEEKAAMFAREQATACQSTIQEKSTRLFWILINGVAVAYFVCCDRLGGGVIDWGGR